MSETCGARHPDDPGRTCIAKGRTHGDHVDSQGVWPNPERIELVQSVIGARRTQKRSRGLHTKAARARQGKRELLAEDVGQTIPARDTDPETSHAATAAQMLAGGGSQRAYLLEAFSRLTDATDEEAMDSHPEVSPTSEYSKRCSELRDAGYIEPTGQTRPGRSGNARIVSRITEEGRVALAEARSSRPSWGSP